jgi:hypothetical protein
VALLIAMAELSFVMRIVLELYFALSVDKIVAEFALIGELLVYIGNQFAFALLFPLSEMALVNSFILVLGINSISINHFIFPFPFVNVSIVKNGKTLALFYLELVKSTLITQSRVRFAFEFLVLKVLLEN